MCSCLVGMSQLKSHNIFIVPLFPTELAPHCIVKTKQCNKRQFIQNESGDKSTLNSPVQREYIYHTAL